MDSVILTENYGFVHAGVEYQVMEVGYDWVRIRHRGKNVFIPTTFIERSRRRNVREELPTYEDIILAEEI
jgi:hypothetical protein